MPLSGPFTYLFIPEDELLPVEERIGDKSGGLANDALLENARQYFFDQAGGEAAAAARAKVLDEASPQERKAIAQKIRNEQQGRLQGLSDDALIGLLKSTTTSPPQCGIIPLTIPTQGNNHRAVSMYVSSSSCVHRNVRAMALLEACGHKTPKGDNNSDQMCADVFVGRCYDNEVGGDDWERVDFFAADSSPEADWVQVARRPGGGGGGSFGYGTASQLPNTAPPKEKEDSAASNDPGYIWDQTDEEVEVKFVMDSKTKSKYVKVQFGRDRLGVSVSGETLAQGPTGGIVVVDDSTYTLQDVEHGRELCITLTKKDVGKVWPYAVQKHLE